MNNNKFAGSVFNNARGLLATLGIACLVNTAQAQVVVDPAAPGAQRPTVLTTPNGVPQVNIQTPSAAGVSRNTYTQFDVQAPGVILNNARTNAPTQLGGWIQGNPWLATGTARVILNEVNSNNPSYLRGYIEVGGDRAQVIIANPAGITCEGCGYINANRATLTTGTPIMNGGSLDGYLVQRGAITIQGAGMDASQVDFTDVIARAVQVNAGIWANDLKITAGANRVSADHTQITATAGIGAPASVAIDVAQLGGMYAGKIRLIGTESGVGVRNAGQIGASAGEIIVTADGRLENRGRILAAQAVSVTASGVTNVDGVIGGSNVRLDSRSYALDNTRGTIAAQGNLDLRSGALTNDAGLIQAAGSVSIDTHGAALINTNAGSTGGILAYTTLILTTGNLDNQSGFIGARGDITLTGATLDNRHGTISGGHAIALSGTRLDNRGGELQGAGDIALRVGSGTIDNSASLIRAGASVLIEAGSLINAHTSGTGQGIEGFAINVAANHIDNGSGVMRADDAITLTATGSVDNALGLLSSGRLLQIIDTHAGSATLRSLSLSNTGGQLLAGQTLSIDVASLSGDGSVLSHGDIAITLTSNYTHTGTLQANGAATLATTGVVVNQSSLLAGTSLTVSAASIDNRVNGEISAGSVQLAASHTIINRGLIDGQSVALDALTLNNLGAGRIYGDLLSIAATTLTNNAESGAAPVIAARQRLDIGAQTLTNRDNALIFSAGDIAIGGTLDGSRRATGQALLIDNHSATIEALGSIELAAAQINNIDDHFSTHVVTLSQVAVQEYVLNGSPNRYAPGQISTYIDEVTHLVTPEGVSDNWVRFDYTRTTSETQVLSAAPGQILSGDAMRLTAGTLVNDKSRIVAGATLTAAIGTLHNLGASGDRTIADAGTAYNFFRIQVPGSDDQGIAAAAYMPAPTLQTISVRPATYQQNTAPAGTGTQLTNFAANSASPMTSGATAVSLTRVGTINTTVSNSSLFMVTSNPSAGYLIETDARFANYRTWLSSDYMLQQLSLDPATSQKRMGDGFYEQRLIREQVAQLTGRRFLDSYTTDEAQYRALIDNGVTVAHALNLRPGIALSAEQMAQLTSDIVWLVEKEVTLPNGQVTKALAPQVYVRVKDGDIDGTGALLSGYALNLNLAGDAINSGTIAGRTLLSLTAENVANLGGRISAANAVISARTDVNSIGGVFDAANSLSISAGRDLNVVSQTREGANAQSSRTSLSRIAGLYVTDPNGTLTATAGRDVNLSAAQISNAGAGGTTLIAAGNNLNLATVTESSQQAIVWNAANFRKEASRTDIGTTIQAAGDIRLAAGNDLNAKAASVSSDNGALVASAAGNINLSAGEMMRSLDEAHQIKGSNGMFSSKTKTTRDTLSDTSALGTTLSANSVQVAAGKAITAQATNIAGTGNVTLQAGTDISVRAGENLHSERHLVEEKTSGFSASFTSVGYGKSSAKETYDAYSTSAAAATIGSVNGDVALSALKNLSITGSDVLAGGNITLSAQEVAIDAQAQTRHTLETHARQQSSMTIGVVGTPLDTIKNLREANKAKGTLNRYSKIGTEIGASALTAPQVAISFGKSSSTSSLMTDEISNRGSNLGAGGNLLITATGTGAKDAAGQAADGDITLTGSTIKAAGTAQLSAQRDINLLASTDQYRETSTASSHASSFSTAMVTPGDAVRNISGSPNSSGVKMSPFGKSTSSDLGNSQASVQTGTQISAINVALISNAGGILIQGSNISASRNTDLLASLGAIDVSSGQDNRNHTEDHTSKVVGDLGSNATSTSSGTSSSVGVRKSHSTLDTSETQQSTIRSSLSAGEDLNLRAKQDITVRGTDLSAGNNLTAVGQNINFDPGLDSAQTQQSSQMSQWGLTASVGGYAVDAAKAMEQAISTKSGKDQNAEKQKGAADSRLAALYAAQAVLTLYNGMGGNSAPTTPTPAQPASNSGSSPIKLTVSIGSSRASSQSDTRAAQAQGSTLNAGQTIDLRATGRGALDSVGRAIDGNITATGTQISATNVALSAARDLILQSAQDSSSLDSQNKSASASVGVGFGLGGAQNGFTIELAAARARGDANGVTITNHNTHVTATETLTIESGNDTTLKGAVASAKQVIANVTGNLNLESLQDTDSYKSKDTSGGVSVSLCIPPLCYGASSGSVSVFNTKANGDFASVMEQSGIRAGDDGFQIKVGGNTGLKGAVIASTPWAELANRNSLATGTLTTSDIQNKSAADAKSTGASLGTDIASQGKYGMTKAILATLLTTGKQSEESSGITRSAVGAGTVVIDDESKQLELSGKSAADTVANLNRDTVNSQSSAERFDAQTMAQRAQTDQKIKQEVFKQVTVYTDDAYKELFQSDVKFYRITCKGAQQACINDPKKLTIEVITREEAKKEGKVLAVNGILNDYVRGAELAYQNAPLDDDQLKPSSIVLVHIAPARTVVGEFLAGAYEVKFAPLLGYTNPDYAYADTMQGRGKEETLSLGHSRGTAVQTNAFNIAADSGYTNPQLSVLGVGSPLSMVTYTNAAARVTTEQARENVSFTYLTNDPVAIAAGNAGDALAAFLELFHVMTANNSAHSCYGTGAAGCSTIAAPVPGGPTPSNQQPGAIKTYRGGMPATSDSPR